MVDQIVNWDKDIFLFLNGLNHKMLDPIMLLLSSYLSWSVVFIAFGMLLFVSQRRFRVATVVFYALSILLSTTLTNLLKIVVKRPRPIHEESWKGLIHSVERYSEAFSFFSSHAATTFCIASFVFCVFGKRKFWGYLAYVWAFSVSYSRIYLAKHYPLDVLVGMLFGILMGYMGYKLLQKYILVQESKLL